MITNTGKSLIARYLLGQSSDYASYIAIGCGPTPLDANASFGDYSTKENLDFEMLRVPIISRGTITETSNNLPVTKIVLTAELPTENRYEISEIGVFSAGSNPSLGAYGSRTLFSFSDSESWLYGASAPSLITTSVDNAGAFDTGVIGSASAFYLNSDNKIFTSSVRKENYQTPRFMNTSLLIAGNSSSMTNTAGVLGAPETNSTPIRLNATSINLDKYAANDELKIAFSVIDKLAVGQQPALGSVRIKVQFRYSADANSPKAEFDAVEESVSGLTDNRYFVVSKPISEMVMPEDFSWASVTVIHIYVSAYETTGTLIDTNSSSDFYVALDGLRIENSQTNNPIYGMIGYSVLKTKNAETVVKKNNSNTYVEFRFALDVN